MADDELKRLLQGLFSDIPIEVAPSEALPDEPPLAYVGDRQGEVLEPRDARELEKLTARFQAAARLSHAASSILTLDELMPQVVDLIRREFNYYYVGIFLADQQHQWAVLQAGTGEAGQQMMAEGYKLEVGGPSTIGWCVANAQARLALDAGEDAVRFDNPLLPDTRSELALPLLSRSHVLGALTIQSTQPADFAQEEVTILQAMADQLANAIENARLFQELQATLRMLARRDAEHSALIDNIPDGIYFKDAESRFTRINLHQANVLGLSSTEAAVGKTDRDFFSGEFAEQAWADERRLIESKQPLIGQIEKTIRPDGEERWVSATKILLTDDEGEVTGLVGISRDITELKAAEEMAQRQATELQLAAEISKVTTSLLDPDQLMQQAVDLMTDRFGLYYAGLFLVDDTGEWAIVRAGTGKAGRSMLQSGHRLPVGGRSMIGQCVANAKAGIALDVGAEPAHFDNPLLPETRSELALPLLSRGRAIGALTIQSTAEAAFSEGDITALQTMADQLANAIENARLFEAQQHQLRELGILFETSTAISSSLELNEILSAVALHMARALGVTSCSISDWDPTQGVVTTLVAEVVDPALRGTSLIGDIGDRYPLADYPATAEVLHRRHPGVIHISDPEVDPAERALLQEMEQQSLLMMPLLARDRVVGLVELYEQRHHHDFSTDDIRLCQALANQAATAIENARLFQESERRIQEQATVTEIGQAVASTLDMETLFETVHREVSRLLDANSFYIVTYEEGSDEWDTVFHVEQGERQPKARHNIQSGLTGYMIRTRQPLVFGTRQENLDFAEAHGVSVIGPPAVSWLAVPLIAADLCVGVMCVQNYDRENLYGDRDLAVLSTIAGQVAVALDNARLLAETQGRARELAVLNEMGRTLTGMLDLDSVLESIRRFASQLVDTTNFFVALYDAERNEVSFPLYVDGEVRLNEPTRRSGKGMTEHVIRSRQPLLVKENIAEIQAELGIESIGQLGQSWLGVPMIVGERPIGVITVQSYTIPRVYDEHDRDLLVAVASQAAIAIQNARLFGEQQRTAGMLGERLKQLDCLSDIGRRAQEAPTLPEFLEWVAERIPAAMRYPDVCVAAVEFEGHLYGAPEAVVGNHASPGEGQPQPGRLAQPADELSVPRQMVQGLRIGDETVGRVYVTYPEEQEFADEESALLGDIVRRVSVYIENRRLLEETEQASQRLAEERALLRTLVDSLPDPTFVKDRDSRFTLSNVAHVQILSAASEEEIIGQTDFDRFPQELAAAFYADEQEIMRSGQSLINREEYVVDESGGRRWLWTTKVPLRDDQGRITGLVGINRDITDRKLSEEVLQRRGAQLECLSDIGQRIGEAQPEPEFLRWVAERIPAAFQYPELCLAAIEFEGTTYGTAEALRQPRQMVQSLRRGKEIVGRLCVAYREECDFLDEESALLGDVARRVGGYIENQRLFEQTQAALAEVEATHRRYLQTQWQSYLQQRAELQRSSFMYDRTGATGVSPVLNGSEGVRAVPDLWRPEIEQVLDTAAPAMTIPADPPLPREGTAAERGGVAQAGSDGGDDGGRQQGMGLAVPIVLRGQTIGVLGIEDPDTSQRWSDEQVTLLQEVGQQLALALENARLFEETQRRAERERLITNITAQIRSSTDMLGVMETAASELGKALGTSRVLVRLASVSEQAQTDQEDPLHASPRRSQRLPSEDPSGDRSAAEWEGTEAKGLTEAEDGRHGV